MTKAELVKAARDMDVTPSAYARLLGMNRTPTTKGALESWCPPMQPARPARVQRLPPAAAPCGLVMDGDRIELHRTQCSSCATGKQAPSYAGIDRTFPLDPLGLGRTCGHSSILKDCKRCVAALPPVLPPQEMFVAPKTYEAIKRELGTPSCCPIAYNGGRGHSDWCEAKPVPVPKTDKMPSDDMINQIERSIDEAFKACGIPADLFRGTKACNGACMKPSGLVPGSFTMCSACGEKLKAEIARAAPMPPILPVLPHLSGCDCSKCKVGRAAACCNIGWHRSCAGAPCPFHAPKVAPAPLMLLNEWDLLPDG